MPAAGPLRFDAWHLPGLALDGVAFEDRSFGDGAVTLRLPVATPALVEAAVQALRDAAPRLRQRPVHGIVDALAAVGRRFARGGPDRALAQATLAAVTGYSPPMIALALDWVGELLAAPALHGMLARELGDPRVLDGLQPRERARGRSQAFGAPLTAHVFSGNVPGVPALSLASALMVKSACLAKAATEEPVFPALFAQALARVDPELGRGVVALNWRGGDAGIEAVVLREAEALVVYGGDAAIDSLRRRTPARTHFLGYGHKLSFAMLDRDAVAPGRAGVSARAAARDVSMFDQQGCLSPHVVCIEGSVDTALGFAPLLAAELAAFEAEIPRGRIGAGEAAAIQRLRGHYEMRSFVEPGVGVLASPGGTAWTVLVDPDPRFEASCLNRTVRVKPVADLALLPAQVEGIRRWLQSVGAAVAAERLAPLAEALGALGVTRICPLGRMAEPSAEWHHDGRANLTDLLRWMDCDAF